MKQVLVPCTEFLRSDLAPKLHELVASEANALRDRAFGGTVLRFAASEEQARESTTRMVAQHRAAASQGAGALSYMIVESEAVQPGSDDIVGMATLIDNARFRRVRAPLSPRVADRIPFATGRFHEGTNISAWTREGSFDTLLAAYRELGESVNSEKPAWTAEPACGYLELHRTLGSIGLSPIARQARYDLADASREQAPEVVIYGNDAMRAHGRLT